MKADVFFESFDMEALLQRFGKKIPGIGLMGRTFVKHPKNLETFALPIVKKMIKDKGFDVEVKSITINAEGSDVKGVSVEFGHIDYAQTAVAALPLIKSLIAKKAPEHAALKALDIVDGDAPALIRAVCASVSDGKKEKLAALAVTEYGGLLVKKGNGFLEKKRLPVKIAGVALN